MPRLSLLLVLGWLLLLAPCLAEPGLRVDGVAIAMSYAEVLEVRGLPLSVGQEDGFFWLRYPAPPKRGAPTSVWFHDHRVVYAEGYTLDRDGEPLFLYGMEGSVLRDELGQPEPLNVFSRWWPTSGVVLLDSGGQWAERSLTSPLGLRDRSFPLDWQEVDGRRWSMREPWADDQSEVWLADDVELGMAEEKARKMARGLEVVFQGGFVRAVRHPASALFSHRMGYHDLSLQLEIGEAPVSLTFAAEFPRDGWYSPAPGGRARMAGGKVAEIELELENDQLFRALERAAQPAPQADKGAPAAERNP